MQTTTQATATATATATTNDDTYLRQLVSRCKVAQESDVQIKPAPTTESANQIEIVVRLYTNKVYGTTYGKALYRNAVYNGTIETKDPSQKYLVDLYDFTTWTNKAKTDGQMDILREVKFEEDVAYSWLQRYDRTTGAKTTVDGFCTLDVGNRTLFVFICDDEVGVSDLWQLRAKMCKPSPKAPQMIATNSDLMGW